MSSSSRVEGDFVCDEAAEWKLVEASWVETLNEPYRATILISTPDPDASAQGLVGKSAEIVLRRRGVEERLAGVVTEVRDSFAEGEVSSATLTLEPALVATLHKKDTRIFQHLTVPDILQQVLTEDLRPFSRQVELTMSRAYPAREYTVQYDETDFDFVHRLMEEEGIAYFFQHDGGPEVLRLTDRGPQHPEVESETGATLTFERRSDGALEHTEKVFQLEPIGRMTGTKVAVRAFDWTHPSMLIESDVDASDGGPTLESYEVRHHVTMTGFSGSGYAGSDVSDQARLLAELQRRDRSVVDGCSTSAALRCGARFVLDGHAALELNREYLAMRVEHHFHSTTAIGGATGRATGGEGRLSYENRFRLLPSEVPYRPDRLRDRPRIHGVQTATVVGPAGEEIHTDPHGRVMVQFHWDRIGVRDDRSSCWIRVVQPMGGPGWGFTFTPRIGQEVVVTFLDGDPDQPIVYGAIFNGENPIPLDFPNNKTRMTMKSSSSPGGNGFNELRFEDLAGAEEIFLHGQKDMNTTILNDVSTRIGNDHSHLVRGFDNQMVDKDAIRTVLGHQVINVGQSFTLNAGAVIDLNAPVIRLNASAMILVQVDDGEKPPSIVELHPTWQSAHRAEGSVLIDEPGKVFIDGQMIHLNDPQRAAEEEQPGAQPAQDAQDAGDAGDDAAPAAADAPAASGGDEASAPSGDPAAAEGDASGLGKTRGLTGGSAPDEGPHVPGSTPPPPNPRRKTLLRSEGGAPREPRLIEPAVDSNKFLLRSQSGQPRVTPRPSLVPDDDDVPTS
ncbi:MAG: type VI secretion system Vgr family protein [Sandaracinaceae bacterium]